MHGWAHNLEIANNRVNNNPGTLSGGITIGQGEFPASIPGSGGRDESRLPGSVPEPRSVSALAEHSAAVLLQHERERAPQRGHVELVRSATNCSRPRRRAAGGVTFCTGADYYKFNYNWVCGNLSTGDGGGVAHIGFSYNGDIEHNTILFNQSTNPTIPTNGGGIIVMGAAPMVIRPVRGPECGANADADCAPGLSDGTGPGLVINANLIMGNSAESGSGGGIRFQSVNGTEVVTLPDQIRPSGTRVNVTNNIIANNVAGWDGAGVSLQDALVVNFVNNTVVSNDTTASSGVLFNTLGLR